MAPRNPPRPRLYTPIEQFGRRCEALSVEELEREKDTILTAVAVDHELEDWYKRRELAKRVCDELRSIVASIENKIDRRIAQVVLATEREFCGLGVGQRLAFVATHDSTFTENQFADRRASVIENLAAALEEALAQRDALPSGVDPGAQDDPVPTIEAEEPSGSGRQVRNRHRILTAVLAAVLSLVAASGLVVALTHGNPARDPWNGLTAAELERRYDGKLPWGDDDSSRCSDQPDIGRSETVNPKNTPPVMVPDGHVVGMIQLRKSPICPTVVWARVLWDGDEQKKYQIPAGWTMHTVMHRPDTNTVRDEQDHSSASEAPYIVSRMLTSARGCVYAETYFTKDDQPDVKTATARTACVQA